MFYFMFYFKLIYFILLLNYIEILLSINKRDIFLWYGYTIAPSDPLFRAALYNSGIDGEIST
jgi:hypothetical protein